jgi:hypothetical protein
MMNTEQTAGQTIDDLLIKLARLGYQMNKMYGQEPGCVTYENAGMTEHALHSLEKGRIARDSGTYIVARTAFAPGLMELFETYKDLVLDGQEHRFKAHLASVASFNAPQTSLEEYIKPAHIAHVQYPYRLLLNRQVYHSMRNLIELVTKTRKTMRDLSPYLADPLTFRYYQKERSPDGIELIELSPEQQGFFVADKKVNSAAEIVEHAVRNGYVTVPEKLAWAVQFMKDGRYQKQIGVRENPGTQAGNSICVTVDANSAEAEALNLLVKLDFAKRSTAPHIQAGQVGFEPGTYNVGDSRLVNQERFGFYGHPNSILSVLLQAR